MPTENQDWGILSDKINASINKDAISPTPQETKSEEPTFGMKLVGITFNPSGDEKVNKAKQLCADLADLLVDEMGERESTKHSNILLPFTIGQILNAQMNVVKLLTFKY